jgi:O-antigen ligase
VLASVGVTTAERTPATFRFTVQEFEKQRGTGFLAFVLVLGAFGVVLAGVNSTVFELERHSVPKTFALNVAALLCLCALLPRWRRCAPGIVEALLTTFVLWSALATLFAANRWLALDALGVSFSGVVLFLAARRVTTSERARRFTLAGLAGAATLAALLGVAQAYGLQLEWLAQDRPPGATFGNRNFLAHLVAIALPPVLVGALHVRSRLTRLPSVLALTVMTAAIVLTRSRAAWLGLAAALCIVFAMTLLAQRRHPGTFRRRRALAVTFALGLAALLAVVLPNRLAWRSDSPYAETLARLADYGAGSGRGRVIQWRNSLRLVPENALLGVGPGNWFVHYPHVTQRGDPSFAGVDPIPTNPWPSSDWVATLVERGPIGMLLLVLAGLAAAIVALRRIFVRESVSLTGSDGQDSDQARTARAVAALGVLAAAFVTGLFDAVLLLAAPVFFVWTTLGLLLPATRPVMEWSSFKRRRRLVLGCTLLFGLLITALSCGRLASLLVARAAPTRAQLVLAARLDPGGHRVRLMLSRRGNCRERVRWAREAAALMPYHEAPKRALRACGVR